MITFYCTTPHRYTVRSYLKKWAPAGFADQVKVVGYSTIDLSAEAAPGLHIFTDFERLLSPERALVKRVIRRLRGRDDIRIWGDPSRWLGRHALLTQLADEGINDFRSFTVDQVADAQIAFPVFVRWANDHRGTVGGVIDDRESLDRRLARVARQHHRRMRWIGDQLLVVEKADAISPDGLYRKYSVFRLGDDFIPGHMIAAEGWVTKKSKVVTDDLVREEDEFLANPKDLDVIKRAFEIAGIDYGRIDWGYVNGRPQIWEINTNPMISPAATPHEMRMPAQLHRAIVVAESLQRQAALPELDRRRRPLISAPERWVWQLVNRASQSWDTRRR